MFVEHLYIFSFIYIEFRIKQQIKDRNKALKSEKNKKNKDDKHNERFQSSVEGRKSIMTQNIEDETDKLSEEDQITSSRNLHIPLSSRLKGRGLKSNQILNEVQANLKSTIHFPQLLKENILQNFFQNYSQNLD